MKKKKQEKKKYNPTFTIFIITIVIMIASFIFSILGIDAEKAAVVNGTLETSLSVVNNIFSIDGLQYILNHIASNFAVFEPLALLIISLTGISIGETSGLFKALFKPLRKVNLTIITFITLFLGVLGSFFGSSAYVILIPFVAVMYQYIGRNPLVGAMTAFLGITAGYGTNILFSYDDYILGQLTELSATVEIDKTYQYHLMSNSIIMIVSTILFVIIGTIIINRFLANKFPRKYKLDDEVVVSKKGMIATAITFFVMVAIVIYMIIPGLKFPASGALLDFESDIYVEQLLGTNSPFRNGFVFIVTAIITACSLVYGKVSGTMDSSHAYGTGLSKSFKDLGYLFVLMFLVSVMASVLDYTNLGEVIACKLIDFTSSIPMNGLPLIILAFFIIVLISILIPDLQTKWTLASPLFIPLFMKANITPDFTQFLFKVADGIGKCFSPTFVYFIVLVGFLEKYSNKNEQITIFGTMRVMLPAIILFTIFWLLIIVGWYVVGLPLGSGSYPTL